MNNTPASEVSLLAQMQNILYQLKTHMLAAGGTVIGSSDGVTVIGGLDAVDRWLAPANIIRGSGGANRSWIVIRHTASGAGSIDVLIAYSTASDQTINLSISTSPFTGGLVTADPTATVPGNTNTTSALQVVATPVAPVRFSTMRSTVGDWIFLIAPVGSGLFTFHFQAHQLSGVEAGDTHIWYTQKQYLASGRGVPAADSTATNVGLWTHTGALGGSARGIFVPDLAGSSSVMGSMTSAGSPVSGSYPALPAVTGFQNRIKGTLVDIALAPADSSVLIGTEEPASPATSTTMIAGNLWVPNGGITPTL